MPATKLVLFVITRSALGSDAQPDEAHYKVVVVSPEQVPLLMTRVCRAAQLAKLEPDVALGQIAMDQDPVEMGLWVRALREKHPPLHWNPSLLEQLAGMSVTDPVSATLCQFLGVV